MFPPIAMTVTSAQLIYATLREHATMSRHAWLMMATPALWTFAKTEFAATRTFAPARCTPIVMTMTFAPSIAASPAVAITPRPLFVMISIPARMTIASMEPVNLIRFIAMT